jgi:signal transduction histidine kinase/CheY-like chemotaxis protein
MPLVTIPGELEEAKRRRNTLLAVYEVPLLRLIGSIFIEFGVLLIAPQNADVVAIILTVQVLVSSFALNFFYERFPFLNVFFLAVDLPVWTLAIYFSGAEKSWLFFILLMRVADQTQTTFRRCLGFAILGTICYAGMLVWVAQVDHRPPPFVSAAAQLAFVGIGGLYISLTARTSERRLARLADAIRTSRDLITRLEQQSAELTDAQHHAEEASAAKSDFLANMSHEMRTPLHGVMGMLQLAIDGEQSPERVRRLQMARRSAESLLGTIDDILDFSKIEARKLELEPIYFSLRDLITETMKTVGITAAEKGVALSFVVDPDVADRVWGDALRLRQIITNLVGNAIKFTAVGEVTMRVAGAGGDRIAFEVRDTGIGIEASKRQAIFLPFAQADSTHSRRYGGTGLGLSIVARLVEAMHGSISVESEPGRGSTFRFDVVLESDPLASAAARPAWEASLEGMRVLVVEPHPYARAAMAATLRAHGIVPEPYASMDEAMRPSIRPAYACIVTDVPASDRIPSVAIVSPLKHVDDDAIVVARPVGERELIDAVGVALGLTDRQVSYTLQPETAPKGRLRVLVADDHPVNQEFAAEALRRLGCDVALANDGNEALAQLRGQPFDFVLMDVHMPELNGLEVTRMWRAEERGRRVPIFALTAHTTREDRDRCLDAGMDGFLSKPIDRASLAAALRRTEIAGGSIIDVVAGDARLLLRVREAFAKQTPALLSSIRTAIDTHDAETLQKSAHTLKGAISNFGVDTTPAQALEHAGRDQDFALAAQLFPRLEDALRDLEHQIDAAARG